VRGLTV